jgi:lipopolysaccharide/colanic/teichoic acid biosynthesis glycosyltransferase
MKRLLDLLLVVLALPLVVPLMAVTGLLVRLRLGSPVFYRQRRSGRWGVSFDVIKFRSMTDARGADGGLLPDAQRLTRFGRWLRSTSLDELPELWNILRGEMSWVGPRPLPVHYIGRYAPRQRRRLEAPPGLTGWAQINGRNAVDWPQRLEMDVDYVERRSLLFDLRILCRTFVAVCLRRGIAAEGEATMREFKGAWGP